MSSGRDRRKATFAGSGFFLSVMMYTSFVNIVILVKRLQDSRCANARFLLIANPSNCRIRHPSIEQERCIVKRARGGMDRGASDVLECPCQLSGKRTIPEWLVMLSTICIGGKLHHSRMIESSIMIGLQDEPDLGRKTCFIRQTFLLCSLFHSAGGGPWLTNQQCRSRKNATKTTDHASWHSFL